MGARQRTPTPASALLAACLPLALCGSATSAQIGGGFDLSWHSIDGGGITFAQGGVYTIGATLGQYDAAEPLSGGIFTVRPGYWPGAAPMPCNLADFVAPFGILNFSDVFEFLVAFGNMDPIADLDVPFGVWDFTDVFAFIVAFGEGCP